MKNIIFTVLLFSSTLLSGELEEKLFQSIKDRDLQTFKELIEKGANVLAKDRDGKSILYRSLALVPSNKDFAGYLIHKQSFLISLFSILSEIKDIDEKISPNGLTALYHSIAYNNIDFFYEVLERDANVNLIVDVVDTGVGYNLKNLTPLTFSLVLGNATFAKRLIKAGADVNHSISIIENNNTTNLTPFELAVVNDQIFVADWISNKINLHQKNFDGLTPLSFLLENIPMNEDMQTVKDFILVAHGLILQGSDVNSVNSANRTLLHFASAIGHSSMIEDLISSGADKSIKDRDGFTPLDVAKSRQEFFLKNDIEINKMARNIGDFNKTIQLLENFKSDQEK